MLSCDFCRGWYSPLNGTMVNVVLCDLDLFQDQTISCYAFVIKKLHKQQMSPADLPQLTRPLTFLADIIDSWFINSWHLKCHLKNIRLSLQLRASTYEMLTWQMLLVFRSRPVCELRFALFLLAVALYSATIPHLCPSCLPMRGVTTSSS